MSETQSKKLRDLEVVIASAVATLPAPSAPPSQAQLDAFAAWGANFTPRLATISIDADGATTITSAVIAAYDIPDAQWRAIAAVNGGLLVSLTADIGYEELLTEVGIFGPLTVYGAVSGGNVTVKATPLASTE